VSGDGFVGLVSGLAVFDEVLTDREMSTLARHNSSQCQHAVGTLLSWPDIRSRAADTDHVTVVSRSQCLRPGIHGRRHRNGRYGRGHAIFRSTVATNGFLDIALFALCCLWSPYGIGQTIIFLPCGLFFYLPTFLSFFPRLISAVADWMSAILPHMVWP